MADIYVGIDPGKGGAIAFMRFPEICKTLNTQILDCPLIGKAIDGSKIRELFEQYLCWATPPKMFVAIEKAQAMPKQGTVSMFNYGVGYGLYLGILTSLRIPFMEVHPQKWKKEFGLIRKPKSESIRIAKQLFPLIENIFLKKHDGRAEALLLAEFARRRVP